MQAILLCDYESWMLASGAGIRGFADEKLDVASPIC